MKSILGIHGPEHLSDVVRARIPSFAAPNRTCIAGQGLRIPVDECLGRQDDLKRNRPVLCERGCLYFGRTETESLKADYGRDQMPINQSSIGDRQPPPDGAILNHRGHVYFKGRRMKFCPSCNGWCGWTSKQCRACANKAGVYARNATKARAEQTRRRKERDEIHKQARSAQPKQEELRLFKCQATGAVPADTLARELATELLTKPAEYVAQVLASLIRGGQDER